MGSLNPRKSLTEQVLTLSPFYRGGIEGTEKLNDMSKATELVSNRTGI